MSEVNKPTPWNELRSLRGTRYLITGFDYGGNMMYKNTAGPEGACASMGWAFRKGAHKVEIEIM